MEPATVLVADPSGQWRDEALVATDQTVSAEFVIQGYCRRWSVELASSSDSKQHLGLHDPQQVCEERSVERNIIPIPRVFLASLTILWYCLDGHRFPRPPGAAAVQD